jgi:hypothetical protein
MPVLNHANAADYALIALYFGIVMFVGWYSSRKNQTTDDYFKGGGKIPWFLAGVSNWVSGFSAFMFVAAAGFTYKHGLGAAVVFTAATWAYLVGAFYFAVPLAAGAHQLAARVPHPPLFVLDHLLLHGDGHRAAGHRHRPGPVYPLHLRRHRLGLRERAAR